MPIEKQKPLIVGFEDINQIISYFDIKESEFPDGLLYARYDEGCYEGSAFLLFKTDGKFYEVNASHCSCYGLEGQFDLEETTLEALLHRAQGGRFTYEESTDKEIKELILNLSDAK